METKQNLFGKTIDEIKNIFIKFDLPGYAAGQVYEWIYKKNVLSFELMTNISKENRHLLKTNFSVDIKQACESVKSKDGTIKYIFSFRDKIFVEAVLIPDKSRTTLCVSSQYGCIMGCKFCKTALLKKGINLTTDEILSQIYGIAENSEISNIVFMGMGEPLLNYENVLKSIKILTSEKGKYLSNKKITLSTVGILPELNLFLKDYPCELAISLHNPFSEERKLIVPAENKYPISKIINFLKEFKNDQNNKSKTVSFEYIVFKNFNHSKKHAKAISQLLNGLKAKINLMTYHNIPEFNLQAASIEEIVEFQNNLKDYGFTVTIRKSKGMDIGAACGLLASGYEK